MKKIAFFLLSFCMLISCKMSDYQAETIQTSNSTLFPNEKSESRQLVFAKLLCAADIDVATCKEVKSVIEKSISLGFDESLILADLFSATKAGNNSYNCPMLLSKIKSVSAETKSENFTNIFNDPTLQIYWPYSDNWDGVSLPTITYLPEDEDQNWNWGIKYMPGNDDVNSRIVMVDESYAITNPVWVINKNVIPYEYIQTIRENASTHNQIITKSSDFHPWILDQVKMTKQYDGIFSAGNNVKITITIPPTTGSLGGTNAVFFTILRKYAKGDGTWVAINRTLNDNWIPEQYTNHMLMVETDGGTEQTITFGNQISDGQGNVTTVSQSVTYEDEDDIINQWLYYRDVLLAQSPSHEYVTSDGKTYLKMHIQQ
ncbi:MAG: hypothetical protein KBT08_08905 [Bacteroidales bacterium]|nr:hypothetical protein [Candidatus Cryptobacteroides onthequi]